LSDRLGTIAAGKLADLVLLDANPLDNIAHTKRIAAVVVAGRLLDRSELDGLLERAEKAASEGWPASRSSARIMSERLAWLAGAFGRRIRGMRSAFAITGFGETAFAF
jgi:adenine deaminase